MKRARGTHSIIPVRFKHEDMEVLRKEAEHLRLSLAAVVRMRVAETIENKKQEVVHN